MPGGDGFGRVIGDFVGGMMKLIILLAALLVVVAPFGVWKMLELAGVL